MTAITTNPPSLEKPLFTLSIEDLGGISTCTFGSIPSQYADRISYAPIIPGQKAWAVEVTDCDCGDHHSDAAFNAYIDTASNFLQLPNDIVDLYFQQLGDSAVMLGTRSGYVYDCDIKLPDFSLSIGQYTATVPGELLAGSEVEGFKGCMYKVSSMTAIYLPPMFPLSPFTQ